MRLAFHIICSLAWLLALAALGLVSGGLAHAQARPEEAGAAEKPAAAAAGPKANGSGVETSPLDTFLLRDGKGNLVPVLGMPFEEFEQLLRLKKGLAAPAGPAYTLDSLTLAGNADGAIANLQMKATIRLRSDNWVRVPLQMRGAAIRETPQLEGTGEHYLAFDEAAGGYVCWLKSASNLPLVLSLQVGCGLNAVGDETRLSITLPRATESSLRVNVAEPAVEAVLLAGDGIATARSLPMLRSEISVLGAGGDLQLAWRARLLPASAAAPQLEAIGEILVRVESEHRITSDARLKLRSFGADLEVFTVQLPPGMELVPISVAGYSVTPLPTEPGPGSGQAQGQLVEVRLEKPASGAVEIRLLASSVSEGAGEQGLMPARFDVRGAVRQRGTIDFVMEGDWQLRWDVDSTVRRLDPAGATAAPRVIARFDYFRQPCGLQLHVSPQPARVSVEPVHVLRVDARQMRLETTLKYRFRGARAAGIALELGEWELQRLSPEEWFEKPAAPRGGSVQIPFRAGTTPPAELELKLELTREMPETDGRISVTFPRPEADTIAPAALVVEAADNLEWTPLLSESVGLLPEPVSAAAAGKGKPAHAFRELPGDETRLAASFRVLSRITTVSAKALVRLQRDRLMIEQRLFYRVDYVPQHEFTLVVPERLAEPGRVQISQEDQALNVVRVENLSGEDELPRLRFLAKAEQLGDFEVVVRYTSAAPRLDEQEAQTLSVPLVAPIEEGGFRFAGQEITFAIGEGWQIEPAASAAERPANSSSAEGVVFRLSQPGTASDWTVRPEASPAAADIVVSKAWIQTWLGGVGRDERVSWRLTTNQDALRIRLPPGVSLGSVQAAIDARQARIAVRDPGMVRIDWPASARGREAVLELWYQAALPPVRLGMLRGKLPSAQLEGASAPRRTYWQLAIPEAQHLLAASGNLEAEMAWNTDRWPLSRRPMLDQLQLEAWLGASRQDPLPRGTNQYLFGSLGQAPALEVVVADRRLLIAVGSGAMLALGLLLLHVPRLRSPSIFLVLIFVLGALALAAPDAAILIGQWSLAGLLVALAATAWMWLTAGRPAEAPPVESGSARWRDGSSTQPLMTPLRGSSLIGAAPALGGSGTAEPMP